MSDNVASTSTLPAAAGAATSEEPLLFSAASAESFISSILIGNGASPSDARIVAASLIEADLRGVDTHGANRIPSYMERVRQGVLDPAAEMQVESVTPVVGMLDANNG